MTQKPEGSGISMKFLDKIVERVQTYGKLIIIVGGFFVAVIIFYLNVKSTSDLTIANNIEISEVKKDFTKKLQTLTESVNDKIESEFRKRDETTTRWRQSSKESNEEMKRMDNNLMEMIIENVKDVAYIKGHLKLKDK